MIQISLVCGMDEAGRGPLAGPVSAAAVILPSDFPIDLLNDSKKLSEKKRLTLENMIKERSCWGVALIDHKTIDKINILQASLLAMKNAYEIMESKLASFCEQEFGLEFTPTIKAIVDGKFCPDVPVACTALPKADASVPEVMAASILAKNYRDRIMVSYDAQFPEYGYAKHKGYPTAAHIEICRKIGPSPIQRRSFKY